MRALEEMMNLFEIKNHIIRIALVLTVLLLGRGELLAQNGAYLTGRASTGFILAHKTTMNHMLRDHASSFELSYDIPSSGKKSWHNYIPGTRQGIALYQINSGFEGIGSISSLYGTLDFPLYKNDGYSSYFFRFGSGLSYVEKRFDRKDNFRNVAIGTHLNLTFLFALKYQYYFDRWKLGLGATFAHSSSGAYRIPNLGVNIPMIDFTVGYKIHDLKPKPNNSSDSTFKKHNLDILLSTGPRAVSVLDEKKYFIHTLQLDYHRFFHPVLAATLGTDFFYNNAVGLVDIELNTSEPQIQIGAKVGAALKLDKYALFLQSGFYVKGETDFSGPIYQRFGGKYLLNEKIVLNFALKTHLTRADNFEIGIGYRL